ncbi:TPA: MFS transporter [Staphylococcus pseudintermedius]
MSIKTASLLLFNSVSSVGSRIFSFACAFYILQHTDSTIRYTIYLTAMLVSTLVIPPLLDTFADRYHNKLVVMIAQLLNVIFLFIFTIAFDTYFDYIIILGVILSITDVTIRTFIDTNINPIVKDDFERYISLSQSSQTVICFLAPIIGGFVMTYFNIETLALLNLLTEVLALLVVLNLPLNKGLSKEHRRINEGLREGYQYLKRKKALRHLCFIFIAYDFLANTFSIGIPIVAIQSMQLSAFQWAIVMLGGAVGTLAVPLAYSEGNDLNFTYRWAMGLQFGAMLFLGGIVLFEVNSIVAMLLLFVMNGLIGVSQPLTKMPATIYFPKTIEFQYQAQVIKFKQTVLQILSPVTLLFLGLMLNHHQTFVYLSIALLILAVYLYLRRRVKNDFRLE